MPRWGLDRTVCSLRTANPSVRQCTWRADTGWLPPEIVPSGPIALHPFCHVFHYALACYEGMKAFKDKDGKVRLFRPELNMKRFNVSAARLCLPQFDEAQLLECIKELLRMDADWVPGQDGYSMYMRPFMFSTTPWLGLTQCTEAMIYVLLSPVGPYFKSGFKPIKLYVDEEYTRAWPGGTGHVKAAGNYGPTVAPQIQAARAGCSQALFVHDKEKLWITEAGTMNVFFFIINDSDEKELVTPSLDDETTLPGITRLSVVELCRAWGEFKVTERHIGVPEVAERIRAGKVLEAFGTGTAAALQPISSFKWRVCPVNRPNSCFS